MRLMSVLRVVDLADLSARLGITVADSTDIVIWTTTPWTIPANQAVALHADIEYQLVKARGTKKLRKTLSWRKI